MAASLQKGTNVSVQAPVTPLMLAAAIARHAATATRFHDSFVACDLAHILKSQRCNVSQWLQTVHVLWL
jgi:hypothetical protein